jgi:hypothetical protein
MVLRGEGMDGAITRDWSFPPHPYTQAGGSFAGVWQALLFYLAPSLLSVAILWALVVTREHATVFTHIALPSYLAFDLVINALNFNLPQSDFKVLQVVGGALAALAIALAAIVLALPSILAGVRRCEDG